MSRVSERVLDASPADDREVRSLLLAARACLENGQPEVSPRLVPRVAPSLAMSTDAAAERGSQPAQRDELAHSCLVPIRGGGSGLMPERPAHRRSSHIQCTEGIRQATMWIAPSTLPRVVVRLSVLVTTQDT